MSYFTGFRAQEGSGLPVQLYNARPTASETHFMTRNDESAAVATTREQPGRDPERASHLWSTDQVFHVLDSETDTGLS